MYIVPHCEGLVKFLGRGGRVMLAGTMLGVRKKVCDVRKKSNRRNGLWLRVCGRFVCYVIKLIEKKRERRFFQFAQVLVIASCGELKKSTPPKNHANILTNEENLIKSIT